MNVILYFLRNDGLLKNSALKEIYFLYKCTKKVLEKWQSFGNKTTDPPHILPLFCRRY